MTRTPADKRTRILNAGLAVMRARGYNGTGVKDIVDAAGVPKGSFYNYFDSKESFVIEALRQVAEGNLTQMRRILTDPDRRPLQRLHEVFRSSIDHFKRTGRFEGGCFIGSICQEVADANDTIRRAAEPLLADYRQAFARCLTEAQRAGEVGANIDAASLAGFVLSAWEGALLQMKTAKNAHSLDDFLDWLVWLFKHAAED